ncbi:LpxL/LpxP family acyltransferase [Plebeiibacterium sediminum]|uniref:Lipid A biosynthesis acyltransferase n=1 Tax=Plebeiibacterium sediminum TaxID=2992112 RepID=A0AAE3M2H5_9BACT|nr:hypothetical protein [Plebeiobacterium sediminum]MCW3785545.1 hypothetical protein [Plebeiobacterium sediminum]
MSKWTGKSKGTPLGYRIFIALIKVDVRLAYALLKPVSFFYLIFSNKESISYFYRERLKYGKLKTMVSIYKNYVFLGKVLIDKIAILSGQKDQYTFNFDGEEHLHQMVKDKKGGLLLGAHMGNWEVAGELLERVDSVINILMVEAEHQKLKDVLQEAIGDKKVNVIPIKDDMSHIFSVIEAFKNKELVAMHGDRFVEGNQTVKIPFLGEMAEFPIGPMVLASKYSIPVTFVFSVKETNTHYHFFATKGKVYPKERKPALRDESIKVMLTDYVNQLQLKVEKYPLQWFNYHPFWENEKK